MLAARDDGFVDGPGWSLKNLPRWADGVGVMLCFEPLPHFSCSLMVAERVRRWPLPVAFRGESTFPWIWIMALLSWFPQLEPCDRRAVLI